MPGGSVVKRMPASVRDVGDVGLIPGSGRSPGEGNGNPLHLPGTVLSILHISAHLSPNNLPSYVTVHRTPSGPHTPARQALLWQSH